MSPTFALVTGGNRGLGKKVVEALVKQGKPVLLTARNIEAGREVADSLSTPEVAVKALQLDAADEGSIAALADTVKAEYPGQIDLVVNNAGILVRGVWDAETFNSTLKTNTAGPIAVSRALLPSLAPNALIIMVSSGLGSLANISPDYLAALDAADTLEAVQAVAFKADSPMGSAPPGAGSMTPTYSVAKALLNKAVQLLASDAGFKARGVQVVSTCPGWCRTDMGGGDATRSAEQGADSILWPWQHRGDGDINASFTRDGERLSW